MEEETFQFADEILGGMTENLHSSEAPPVNTRTSFTALLGLPANRAVELLHEPEFNKSPAIPAGEIWNDRTKDQNTLKYAFNCSPTFPSNAALVERAARFSIFASTEDSNETSSAPSNLTENSLKLKSEQNDYESNRTSSRLFSDPTSQNEKQRLTKRKEREKKDKVSAKKSKNVENESAKTGEINKDGEKLPYVHVRARRGQATNSHSLAERARREKINARMKLLQELVPGCSKISGTALVLEEIINHVQSLQRQVEFLSMRVAAVNPRIDFNIDSLLAAEVGYHNNGGNFPRSIGVEQSMWAELQGSGGRRQQHQNHYSHVLQLDMLQSPTFLAPEGSLFNYDSSQPSVSLCSNQLKMEL